MITGGRICFYAVRVKSHTLINTLWQQVGFSSVQDDKMCAQQHLHALHPVYQRFLLCYLSISSSVGLIDNGPHLSFQGRSLSTSSFHTSLIQAMDGVMSSALSPQVVSQAPQHFRSSETQATRDNCFACQSVCSVISLDSGMSRTVDAQKCLKVAVKHCHISVWTSDSTLHFL